MLPLVATIVSATEKPLPPATWETWVPSLGWEDPLKKGTATHSSILAWRIPRTEQSMESQRVRHDWATFTFIWTHSPGPQECKEKTPVLNKCPQVGPGKSIEKRADDKRPISTGQFYTVLLLFLKNHMKSLHTLKSYRNANQNCNEESPQTGQNDLCQKVHNNKCW